jgi:hypothetical protein
MADLIGKLKLEDFEKIKEYNELDLVFKMNDVLKDMANSAQKVVCNNKSAYYDLRKHANDIITLSHIMREMAAKRMGHPFKSDHLEWAIAREKRIMEEESQKDNRLSDDKLAEKIRKIKEAEQNAKSKNGKKGEQEKGTGTAGGERQEAQGEL